MIILKKLAVYLVACGLMLIELWALSVLGKSSPEKVIFHFCITLVGAFVVSHWVEKGAARTP